MAVVTMKYTLIRKLCLISPNYIFFKNCGSTRTWFKITSKKQSTEKVRRLCSWNRVLSLVLKLSDSTHEWCPCMKTKLNNQSYVKIITWYTLFRWLPIYLWRSLKSSPEENQDLVVMRGWHICNLSAWSGETFTIPRAPK